jgi:hypothetical protein
MVEFFLSFLACIAILVGLFFGFFILLGVLRGLPYIAQGLAARWSDDPIKAVRPAKSMANSYSFNYAGFIVALGLIATVLLLLSFH